MKQTFPCEIPVTNYLGMVQQFVGLFFTTGPHLHGASLHFPPPSVITVLREIAMRRVQTLHLFMEQS